MRLALAITAVLIATPVWAGPRCIAHVHQGALPWESDAVGAAMHPFHPTGGSGNPSDADAEVAGIDQDPDGTQWVTRIHEFTWRRADIDLHGDCRRALAQ